MPTRWQYFPDRGQSSPEGLICFGSSLNVGCYFFDSIHYYLQWHICKVVFTHDPEIVYSFGVETLFATNGIFPLRNTTFQLTKSRFSHFRLLVTPLRHCTNLENLVIRNWITNPQCRWNTSEMTRDLLLIWAGVKFNLHFQQHNQTILIMDLTFQKWWMVHTNR